MIVDVLFEKNVLYDEKKMSKTGLFFPFVIHCPNNEMTARFLNLL